MQQPGKFGFFGEIEGFRKPGGESGDVGQVRGERLPFAITFWKWLPIFTCRCVRVVIHPFPFDPESWVFW